MYPSRLFWCDLPSFGGIGFRGVCPLSSVMELDGMWLVVLVELHTHTFLNSSAMSLSRNHDPVTQDTPQTLWWAVSCRNYFLSHPSYSFIDWCLFSVTTWMLWTTLLLNRHHVFPLLRGEAARRFQLPTRFQTVCEPDRTSCQTCKVFPRMCQW